MMRRFLISTFTHLVRRTKPTHFSNLPLRCFTQTRPEIVKQAESSSSSSDSDQSAPIQNLKFMKKKKENVPFKNFDQLVKLHPELKGANLTQAQKEQILDVMNTPDQGEILQMSPNPSPGSLFIGPDDIEWIQTNPAYSHSLEMAVSRDYVASLALMWLALEHFQKEIGPCNEHLLYILRRIIWIARLGGQEKDNFQIAEKAYNIARKLYTEPEHDQKLRFYQQLVISHSFVSDPSKALLIAENVLERRRNLKDMDLVGELTLQLYEATATGLTGQIEEGIKKSQTLYQRIGKELPRLGKDSEKLLSSSIINLAVMKFEQLRADGWERMVDDEMWTEVELKKNGKILEECIFLLKAAVNIAENVPERFGVKEGQTLSKAQKLFKELFDPNEPRFIGVKKPDYSLKDRVENDALIKACFTTQEGALATMNLGYIAYHMYATSEALTYFDIASRALGGMQNKESLQGKAMGYLAATFGQLQGNERMTRQLFDKVLAQTAPGSVERAETLELYGQTLMKEEPTKYEGEEMLYESCQIQSEIGQLIPIKRFMVHPEVSKEI